MTVLNFTTFTRNSNMSKVRRHSSSIYVSKVEKNLCSKLSNHKLHQCVQTIHKKVAGEDTFFSYSSIEIIIWDVNWKQKTFRRRRM